jgi:hypothetical protein
MKFYHVIDNRRRRSSGITIAAEVVPIDDNTGEHRVFCGLSYCAPVEKQFSRPRGRIIAQSRLASDKTLPAFKQFGFVTTNPNGLKAQILLFLKDHLSMDWAYTLVDKELARLSTVQAALEVDRINSEQERD